MTELANECWIVTEGVTGMENQCLGLAERLALPHRIFRLSVRAPWRWLAPHSIGSPFSHLNAQSDEPKAPWPRLFIGCGRQSIPFAIAIKKLSSNATLTVQCQDPRVDTEAFDLVIPPEHDGLSGRHVFSIIGSPNRITPEKLAQARGEFASLYSSLATPRVAVLIGGNSRSYGTLELPRARELARMLCDLSQTATLMITTSRRTAPDVAALLRAELAGSNVHFWNGETPNPYFGMLAWADAFVVTSDSVNMICEAATTGQPVHIFRLNARSKRAQKFHESLAAWGITRPFTGQIERWTYPPLDETSRAAHEIQKLLDARVTASDMKA